MNLTKIFIFIVAVFLSIGCDNTIDDFKTLETSCIKFQPRSKQFKFNQEIKKEIFADRIKIQNYEQSEIVLKSENINFKNPQFTFEINFSIEKRIIELKKDERNYKIYFDDSKKQWLCEYNNKIYSDYQNLIPEIALTKDLLDLYVKESDFINSDIKYETLVADDKAPEALCGTEIIIVTKFNVVKSVACYEANADLQFECSNQYCIGCCFTYPGCDSIFAIDDYFGACTCRGVPCIQLVWPDVG